jgi:hypothetical protein
VIHKIFKALHDPVPPPKIEDFTFEEVIRVEEVTP